jgi:PPM family protein phosphatase
MATCPKCKADNRPEAAFCALCGAILLVQPAPASPDPIQSLMLETEPEPEPPSLPPVILPSFSSRSDGTVFGERFQYDTLLCQDEHEIHYTVTELTRPDGACIKTCSNPNCQTIHYSNGSDEEKFCTQCGQVLEKRSPLLLLEEADNNKYGRLQPIIDLHMAHPNVHTPVAFFQEDLPEGTRYYLATPYSGEMPDDPEITQVLEWGLTLAKALDYLHAFGVAFMDEQGDSNFGMYENKPVWRNFNNARVLPVLTDREKINNIRQLTQSMFTWMTGKASFQIDPSLPPRLNELFDRALLGEGYTSGAALAKQLEVVKSAGVERFNLDIQVGRRTHIGRVRSRNEDSLLCLELNYMTQGISTPAGIFGVADGMGGHATGELASSLVIQVLAHKAAKETALLKNLTPDEHTQWIKQSIQASNQAVYEARQKAGSDMGSTLAFALVLGSQAYLAHVGDSRIYLVNQTGIRLLTNDHSLVQHLINTGRISPEEAQNHPERNVIYRSLGEKPDIQVDNSIKQLFLGDRLLLCSDGLSGMLESQTIHKIIMEAGSPQAACDGLIEAANQAGGEDNISAIVIEVISV